MTPADKDKEIELKLAIYTLIGFCMSAETLSRDYGVPTRWQNTLLRHADKVESLLEKEQPRNAQDNQRKPYASRNIASGAGSAS
jgi:hypothetical protein